MSPDALVGNRRRTGDVAVANALGVERAKTAGKLDWASMAKRRSPAGWGADVDDAEVAVADEVHCRSDQGDRHAVGDVAVPGERNAQLLADPAVRTVSGHDVVCRDLDVGAARARAKDRRHVIRVLGQRH